MVTKLTDRMGMRLSGPKLENIKDTNIRSEGLIKGTTKFSADGDPIINVIGSWNHRGISKNCCSYKF